MPEMPVVSCVCVEPPGWGGIRLSGSGLIVSSPVRLEAPRPRPSLEGDCGKRLGLPQLRPSRLFYAGPDGPFTLAATHTRALHPPPPPVRALRAALTTRVAHRRWFSRTPPDDAPPATHHALPA